MLYKGANVGQNVAIIGSGGIGFDVITYITTRNEESPMDLQNYFKDWGIDTELEHRGGGKKSRSFISERKVYLLKRSPRKTWAIIGKNNRLDS